MGVIKAKFFPQYTPETVKNFTELAKKGYYDGVTFHRVIPGFMIQGGDPDGTGMGGETYKGPGTKLKAEFRPELKHLNGALSMARSQAIDSAGSQFFIVQNPEGAGFLDGNYTVFGQAFEGLDVVEEIANVKRDGSDKPLKPVVMEKVEITKMP
jgi:peptidyl-prolyl cis-trans isomerase B (cyclophilin B)